MLQTTLTNLRTLSFAFVMVAMLGVGMMTPVQQAHAQEMDSQERVALFAQINTLMQLIADLMVELRAAEVTESEEVEEPEEYSIEDLLEETRNNNNANLADRAKNALLNAEGVYADLSEEAEELREDGYSVAKIENELEEAYELLEEASNAYSDGEYAEALELVEGAEEYLEEAEEEFSDALKYTKSDALDFLEEAEDEMEEVIDAAEDDYEDMADEQGLEEKLEGLISTLQIQYSVAENAYARGDYLNTVAAAEAVEDKIATLWSFFEDLEDENADEQNENSDELQEIIDSLLDQVRESQEDSEEQEEVEESESEGMSDDEVKEMISNLLQQLAEG